MRSTVIACALLLACGAARAADPVADCRRAHESDPAAHIACLERALHDRGASPAPQAAATPKGVETAAASQAAAAALPEGLGAEQAKARQRMREEVPVEQATVRIVGVRYDAAGLGHFTLADGQQWKETVATPTRLQLEPGRPYEARIERSRIGGYRMYVEGVRWMHKVERIR